MTSIFKAFYSLLTSFINTAGFRFFNMATLKDIGSVRRFGPRYGWKVRRKFGIIEKEQRKLHKCPYCHKVKVKRVSTGIWFCRKCGSKFTGKAYSVSEKIRVKETPEKEEEPVEEEREEKEEDKK